MPAFIFDTGVLYFIELLFIYLYLFYTLLYSLRDKDWD